MLCYSAIVTTLLKSASAHGGEDVDVGLLGSYIPTSPHGVTTQKTNIDTIFW
jgi:hypothetical protein